ncbi:hypothetical protein B0H10DRAFT_1966303 [Mycena sp. CBHHK59/15]|nr:hypothetical protein B0H10DRAFT_1966303 [Mycena sp. CBHHK59/15]
MPSFEAVAPPGPRSTTPPRSQNTIKRRTKTCQKHRAICQRTGSPSRLELMVFLVHPSNHLRAHNRVNLSGHVLDLAFGVNPIIGQTMNVPLTANQQWVAAQVCTNQLIFANIAGLPLLSYAGAAHVTGPMRFVQAIGDPKFPVPFELDCVNSTSGFMANLNGRRKHYYTSNLRGLHRDPRTDLDLQVRVILGCW